MDNANGFVKFPNAIYDAIIGYRFSAAQLTVVLYVVRKTNGFNTPSAEISMRRMALETGYTRRMILNTVSDLEKMGVLNIQKRGSGKRGEMSVANPKYWDKPVNSTSQVKRTTPVKPISQPPVNSTSPLPVNCISPEPVNSTSPLYRQQTLITDTKEKTEPSAPANDDDEGWEGESWGEW